MPYSRPRFDEDRIAFDPARIRGAGQDRLPQRPTGRRRSGRFAARCDGGAVPRCGGARRAPPRQLLGLNRGDVDLDGARSRSAAKPSEFESTLLPRRRRQTHPGTRTTDTWLRARSGTHRSPGWRRFHAPATYTHKPTSPQIRIAGLVLWRRMKTGIRVGQPPIEVLGSEHYHRLLHLARPLLGAAASRLVDGKAVDSTSDDLDIFWDAMGPRAGAVALTYGEDEYMLFARLEVRDATVGWSPQPGTPCGLDDYLSAGGVWQIANCDLKLYPFRRSRFDHGERP